MRQRDKLRLRAKVEKAWANKDQAVAARDALVVVLVFARSPTSNTYERLMRAWRRRDLRISGGYHNRPSVRCRAHRANDMRLLKEIGA